MDTYIQFTATHRKRLLIVFLLINILAIIGITHISIDADFEIFMPDDSRYHEVTKQMESYFPGSENLMFIINTHKSKIDLEMMNSFRTFQEYLSDYTLIDHVTGPAPKFIINGRQIIRTERLEQEDLDSISSYYENMGELSTLVSYNSSYYGIFEAFPSEGFSHENIQEIEEKLDDYGFTYFISGETYMQYKIFDYILRIILLIPPLALFLIILVFRLQMRSMKATMLSILPAGIGALWTMGVVGWIGSPVSIITVLAPIFTIVIGSADGLHFISHVQDEQERGVEKLKAISSTLKMVGIPMIITTITSMVGFLVLLMMNNSSMRSLALFASLGILLAGCATWSVLPLILTGNIRLETGRTKKQIAQSQTNSFVQKYWGKPSIVLLLVLLAVAAVGIPRISTEFSLLSLYKPSTEVQKGFDVAMKVNNGSIPLFLYLEHEVDPLEPTEAQAVIALTQKLKAEGLVGKAVSPYTILAKFNGAISSSEDAYPDSMKKAQLLYNITERRAENPLRFLIDPQAKKSRIIIFPTDLSNSTLDRISEITADFSSNHKGLSVSATGAQFLFRELNESIIKSQSSCILLAFSIIFLLLLITLKDIRTSLVSLIPIVVSVLVLYGAMGLMGLSLNLISTTIFGMTIGVGIDYAIHFTFVWNSFKQKGLSSEVSAAKAMTYTERPIITNGLGIAIGLSALIFSPLMIHLYVVEMMWVTMIVSMLLSLTVLPTFLRRMK